MIISVWARKTEANNEYLLVTLREKDGKVLALESVSEPYGEVTIPRAIQGGTNSSYAVKVTTLRGNTYASGSGRIIYDGSDWVAEMLGIFVQIAGSGFLGFGSYRVTVTNVTNTNVDYWEQQETAFASGTACLLFEVTEAGAGTYNVYVEKRQFFSWQYKDDKDVDLEWPSGPSIEWVYF